MDLQTRKILFVQKFLNVMNEETVELFENLLKTENNNLTPMTMETYHQRIMASRKDSDNGNSIDADYLLREIQEWN